MLVTKRSIYFYKLLNGIAQVSKDLIPIHILIQHKQKHILLKRQYRLKGFTCRETNNSYLISNATVININPPFYYIYGC